MSSIYEIKAEYQFLLDLLDDPEVDEESVLGALAQTSGALHEKAEQYAMVIRTLENKRDGYKAEADRCSQHHKTIDNNIKRMKTALQDAMEAVNDTKFESGLFKFNVRNNAPSLDCDDELALVNELQNLGKDDLIKVTREPRKKVILDELKKGRLELEYAGIKQTKSLTIK